MLQGKCRNHFLFVVVIICLCLFSTDAFTKPVLIDGILAVVNGEIITLSDLILSETRLYGAEKASNDLSSDEIKRFREKILQDLINERLMIKEAERIKLSPTEEEIKKHIDNIKIENGFQSDEAFDLALAKDGLTLKEFKEDIYEEISLFRIHQRIFHQSIQVTDREILEYYDTEWQGNKDGTRVELSHILLKCSEEDRSGKGSDIIKRANDIIRQLEQGKSFSELASKFSEDVSESEGGYLGWFYIEDLRPEFAKALQGAGSEKIIGPITTDLGYHILFISDLKNLGLEQGSPIWEKIKETLIERKRADFFETWIERLRKNANIEINNKTLSRYQ